MSQLQVESFRRMGIQIIPAKKASMQVWQRSLNGSKVAMVSAAVDDIATAVYFSREWASHQVYTMHVIMGVKRKEKKKLRRQ